jgi:hypothetical protein
VREYYTDAFINTSLLKPKICRDDAMMVHTALRVWSRKLREQGAKLLMDPPGAEVAKALEGTWSTPEALEEDADRIDRLAEKAIVEWLPLTERSEMQDTRPVEEEPASHANTSRTGRT